MSQVKNFYFISKGPSKPGDDTRVAMFREACIENHITFYHIYPEMIDHTHLTKLSKNDALFCMGAGSECKKLEILLYSDDCVNIFSKPEALYNHDIEFCHLLPNSKYTIKSIPTFSEDIDILKNNVEYLGGFPVIIKINHTSAGRGVIKIDSLSSLLATGSYLKARNEDFIIMQFIQHKKQVRYNFVGNKIIYSAYKFNTDDDFRTSYKCSADREHPTNTTPQLESIARLAMDSVGYQIGAVDILIDTIGNKYIAEVNKSFGFTRLKKDYGVDTAKEIVEYLISK
jgi:hypothetical protein